MDNNLQSIYKQIMERVDQLTYIRPTEMPGIDLYMDQVLTFMNERLRHTTRNPREDKILTKTMINNYAKNDLLPPPNKKKYTSDHILLLLFIYYFKGVLSINDTSEILGNISRIGFGAGKDTRLEEIYNEVFAMEAGQIKLLRKDICDKLNLAESTFTEVEGDDRDFLQFFSFICLLSFDVYVKRMLIETAIDSYFNEQEKEPN